MNKNVHSLHRGTFRFLSNSLLACSLSLGLGCDRNDDDDSATDTSAAGEEGTAGGFQVFACGFEFTCEDGSSTTLPLDTCSTQNTISMIILETNPGQICDDKCLEDGAGSSTACAFECVPTEEPCTCPDGVAECYP